MNLSVRFDDCSRWRPDRRASRSFALGGLGRARAGQVLNEEVGRSVTTGERRCSSHPATMTNGVAHNHSLPAAMAQASSGASCSIRRERAPAGPSPCGSARRADPPARRIARSWSVGDRSCRHPRRDHPPEDGELHDPDRGLRHADEWLHTPGYRLHGDEAETDVRSAEVRPHDCMAPRLGQRPTTRAPSPCGTTATRSRPSAKLTAVTSRISGDRANARQPTAYAFGKPFALCRCNARGGRRTPCCSANTTSEQRRSRRRALGARRAFLHTLASFVVTWWDDGRREFYRSSDEEATSGTRDTFSSFS